MYMYDCENTLNIFEIQIVICFKEYHITVINQHIQFTSRKIYIY